MATIKNVYELEARFDARKSFYGKAQVIEYSDGSHALKSYDTIVSMERNGVVTHLPYELPNGRTKSTTTSRHQREFERQFSK